MNYKKNNLKKYVIKINEIPKKMYIQEDIAKQK